MDGLLLPLLLTFLAFAAAVITYRDIRRGGARFYTLEREAILRRASFTLMAAVLLFLGTIFLLITQYQQTADELAVQAGEEVEGLPTLTPTLSTLPPTPTPTATVDPDLPTATATAVVCRAVVQGTGGSGLNLRAEPGGTELEVLQEQDIVNIVVDSAPVTAGGTTWVNVRTAITRTEGWVSINFLLIEDQSCLDQLQVP
ncbi:MAG: hypothetical protein RRC07_15335 [Anaerolineae bacterium]|nr:hypothetical protein [Anaerolineae bacterium]